MGFPRDSDLAHETALRRLVLSAPGAPIIVDHNVVVAQQTGARGSSAACRHGRSLAALCAQVREFTTNSAKYVVAHVLKEKPFEPGVQNYLADRRRAKNPTAFRNLKN